MTADTPTQSLSKTYPVTVQVNGRGTRFQIKRLDVGEFTAFKRDWDRIGRLERKDQARIDAHRRPVINRVTGEPRRALDPPPKDAVVEDGILMESDDEVLARLDLEESDEARTVRETRERAELEFRAAFCVEALTAYVTCDPGQLDDDGAPVLTGADIVRAFGGHAAVMNQLLQSIWRENVLDEPTKKALASLRASWPSSSAPNLTAAGDAPAPTAPAVSEKASASPVTAMASSATSSGATDPTS